MADLMAFNLLRIRLSLATFARFKKKKKFLDTWYLDIQTTLEYAKLADPFSAALDKLTLVFVKKGNFVLSRLKGGKGSSRTRFERQDAGKKKPLRREERLALWKGLKSFLHRPVSIPFSWLAQFS